VNSERRDYQRRSEAQCRVVGNHTDGSTCDEAAAAALLPDTGARCVLRQLASKHLVRCDQESRWKADAVLMSPPSLCRVEPGSEHGDGGDFNGCSAAS